MQVSVVGILAVAYPVPNQGWHVSCCEAHAMPSRRWRCNFLYFLFLHVTPNAIRLGASKGKHYVEHRNYQTGPEGYCAL
jgi:hypothetical protein